MFDQTALGHEPALQRAGFSLTKDRGQEGYPDAAFEPVPLSDPEFKEQLAQVIPCTRSSISSTIGV